MNILSISISLCWPFPFSAASLTYSLKWFVAAAIRYPDVMIFVCDMRDIGLPSAFSSPFQVSLAHDIKTGEHRPVIVWEVFYCYVVRGPEFVANYFSSQLTEKPCVFVYLDKPARLDLGNELMS